MVLELKKNFIIQIPQLLINKRIINTFKSLYILIKIINSRKNLSSQIKKISLGKKTRKIIKPYRLVQSMLKKRIDASNIIKDAFKLMLFRKKVKNLLNKLEENYIIYSSIDSKLLIFIVRYENGLEENLFFEYNDILKCQILLISKLENNLSNKRLKGFFMTDSETHVLDNNYPIEDDMNIIDIPNILNLYRLLDYDKRDIGKRFLLKNKRIYNPFKRRNKSHLIMKNVQFLNHGTNNGYSSSTSLNIFKSILRPTKSFLNFKERKKSIISFGSIEIMAA